MPIQILVLGDFSQSISVYSTVKIEYNTHNFYSENRLNLHLHITLTKNGCRRKENLHSKLVFTVHQ